MGAFLGFNQQGIPAFCSWNEPKPFLRGLDGIFPRIGNDRTPIRTDKMHGLFEGDGGGFIRHLGMSGKARIPEHTEENCNESMGDKGCMHHVFSLSLLSDIKKAHYQPFSDESNSGRIWFTQF